MILENSHHYTLVVDPIPYVVEDDVSCVGEKEAELARITCIFAKADDIKDLLRIPNQSRRRAGSLQVHGLDNNIVQIPCMQEFTTGVFS